MFELLQPVVVEADGRVQEVFASQQALTEQMNALTLELERLANATNTPLLEPYVRKLNDSRRRVGNVNSTLTAIQERLDRMQASVSQVIKARPVTSDAPATAPATAPASDSAATDSTDATDATDAAGATDAQNNDDAQDEGQDANTDANAPSETTTLTDADAPPPTET